MRFDELLELLSRRLAHYESSGDPDLVLGGSVLAEEAGLKEAARPVDPEHRTPEESRRNEAALSVLRRLHHARAAELGEPADLASEAGESADSSGEELGNTADAASAEQGDTADSAAARSADVEDLDQAVQLLQQMAETTPADHPDRAECLYKLAYAHQARFQRDGTAADLDQFIDVCEQAVEASGDHPDQAKWFSILGAAYQLRCKRGGAAADLDRAVDFGERAVAAAGDHRRRAESSYNLGVACSARFARGGAMADADRAVELLEQAVEAMPEDASYQGSCLSSLGNAYLARFQRSEVAADADRAVKVGERAVAAAPGDPGYLSNLGIAYQTRFVWRGVMDDMDRAIDLGQRALTAAPGDHPHRAACLSNLSDAYHRRFFWRGVASDLDRAIDFGEQALAAMPPDLLYQAQCSSNLGDVFRLRFEHGGDVADLDRAVELLQHAVEATPRDHPNRTVFLRTLGKTYQARFEHGGNVADLDQAVELLQHAVEATPRDHPNRPMSLSILGDAYRARFDRGGAVADLDRAIEVGERAVEDMVEDNHHRAACLLNLGNSYWARFDRSGETAELDRAIELLRQAVEAAPAGDPGRPTSLSSLGAAFQVRFVHSGVVADLDRAIDVGEQAVAATPDDHTRRPMWLSNLGVAYRRRFERGGVVADLDRAIEVGEQAVTVAPDDQPNRMMWFSNLGEAYRVRFDRGGVVADLDRAIEVGEQAVAATPDDHPVGAISLSNLGLIYETRFDRGGVAIDLDRAIELFQQAVEETPSEHPYRARYLTRLGNTYRMRINLGERNIPPERLETLAQQVISATTASPQDRVHAGGEVGMLARAMNDHHTAVTLLDNAVALLPSVAPRQAGWADQEHRLGENRGLVAEAIAAHCAVGDPSGAVEVAELGRGILLAAHLDSRTDLSDLDQQHPELARRFQEIRDQLSSTPDAMPGDQPDDTARRVEGRKRIWTEHDEVLTRIRRQPGFDRFLLPPSVTQLSTAAAGGTVVLVNAAGSRSDAIIITAEAEPILLPLPDLALGDVTARAMELLESTEDNTLSGVLRRGRVVSEILDWLWETTVGPIIDNLPSTGTTGDSPPRVWWLPTGVLGLLPLHAAGRPQGSSALDAVVSSYIPTLRALSHAHARPPATARQQLTVALEHTPGLADLPGSVAEATDLHAAHPGTPALIDYDATAGQVLAALPHATWAHFSCHAGIDLGAPSRGGLALYDGTLPIPDISRLELAHAELAYLSACSTAHRGIQHAEESIHLAAAFQLAGFRHVIASLWPLADDIASAAAKSFYSHLPVSPTADTASAALHHVTRELRVKYPDRPDLWALLIHSGP